MDQALFRRLPNNKRLQLADSRKVVIMGRYLFAVTKISSTGVQGTLFHSGKVIRKNTTYPSLSPIVAAVQAVAVWESRGSYQE